MVARPPGSPFMNMYRVGQHVKVKVNAEREVDGSVLVVFVGASGVYFGSASPHDVLFAREEAKREVEIVMVLKTLCAALEACWTQDQPRKARPLLVGTDSRRRVGVMMRAVLKWKKHQWRNHRRELVAHAKLFEQAERLIEDVVNEGRSVWFWQVVPHQNFVNVMKET